MTKEIIEIQKIELRLHQELRVVENFKKQLINVYSEEITTKNEYQNTILKCNKEIRRIDSELKSYKYKRDELKEKGNIKRVMSEYRITHK